MRPVIYHKIDYLTSMSPYVSLVPLHKLLEGTCDYVKSQQRVGNTFNFYRFHT